MIEHSHSSHLITADSGCQGVVFVLQALSTLKKYPLRLERGKDCKILMHFGDKICGMLDKKLQEHIAAGGRFVNVELSVYLLYHYL